MAKSLENIIFEISATCFQLREGHCVFLEILELAFKIIDFFVTFYRVLKRIFRILRISAFQAVFISGKILIG